MNESLSIVKKVSRAQFTQHQARLAHSCCYIPSMVYSLTAVSLNEKQLKTIQKQATSKFTQLCGFEITFPEAVVHGPVSYGGLGFPHLYVESNISKFETIICHINKSTTLGSSICTNISWLQLHTGISSPILESNLHVDYIQDTWFKEIKIFLNSCGASIKINNIWIPTISRFNDRFIMEELMLDGQSKCTRITINNWRMYFNVNTVSDITNYLGKQIRPVFLLKREIKGYRSESKMQWPMQQMPNIDSFCIWVIHI
jgi:hypothetical protein